MPPPQAAGYQFSRSVFVRGKPRGIKPTGGIKLTDSIQRTMHSMNSNGDKLEVIDKFLEMVDGIIHELKSKKVNQKNLFGKIVEPLFKNIEPIVDDYFEVFRNAFGMAKSEENWEQGLALIRSRRKTMFTARSKVRQMIILLRDFENENLNNYSIAILSFFYSTNHETVRNALTDPGELIHLLRSLEKLAKIVASPEDLSGVIESLKKVKKKICTDIDNLLFDTGVYGQCQSFRQVDDESVTKEILRGHTGVTLENLERAWENIAAHYAFLRVNLPIMKSINATADDPEE